MRVVEDPETLLSLLEQHLPLSLPLYGAIRSGNPIKVWTSLGLDHTETADEPWVAIARMLPPSNDQYRIYCSAERDPSAASHEKGKERVLDALTELGIQPGTMLGAVHALWAVPIVALRVQEGKGRASSYNVWLSNVTEETASEEKMEGYELDHGREADLAEMIATSDIPRSTDYLRSLLRNTSVARDLSSPDPDRAAAAWVVSHADGSLGTLFTQPAHRKRGLAKAVVRHRLDQSGTRGFAYVSEGNVASEAVWRGLEYTVGWQAWWIVTSC